MTTPTAPPPLLIDLEGGVLTLTLNEPSNNNRLSLAMISALQETFAALTENKQVCVVVLTAAGAAFCDGHDLAESASLPSASHQRAACLASNDLMVALADCPKITIASAQGSVCGAGLELIAGCDLALAADCATFTTTGLNTGLWDHTAQIALSRLTSHKFAMEMLITDKIADAADAVRMGLVNRVIKASELASEVNALAHSIASKSSYALGMGKYSYAHQAPMDRVDAYNFVAEQFHRDVQSEDGRNALATALEQRNSNKNQG